MPLQHHSPVGSIGEWGRGRIGPMWSAEMAASLSSTLCLANNGCRTKETHWCCSSITQGNGGNAPLSQGDPGGGLRMHRSPFWHCYSSGVAGGWIGLLFMFGAFLLNKAPSSQCGVSPSHHTGTYAGLSKSNSWHPRGHHSLLPLSSLLKVPPQITKRYLFHRTCQ